MHNALEKTHRLVLKGVGRCAFLFRDYFFVDIFDFVCKVTFIECGAEETENHNIPAGSVTCTDCGADIIN